MEKYLFVDETGGVREVQSKEELNSLIQSAPRADSIRIWVFNTHEWISYADFSRNHKGNSPRVRTNGKQSTSPTKKDDPVLPAANGEEYMRPSNGKHWLKKLLFFSLAAVAIFLVYNFTLIDWKKASSLNITADHPANVPPVDTDSIIQTIERYRGQKLDRTTRTNLRIRNGWPDRILLQLHAERDSSSAGSRFYNIELSIDNTTGYNIDNAVVKLTTWKNMTVNSSDTLLFRNISYALVAKRLLKNSYRADSLSVSFQSIKARSFNFCYSADKKSNYGNAGDRWFCRE